MKDKLYIKKFIRDDGETLSFDGEEIYLAENNTLLVRANPATTAVEYTESDGGEMIRQRNATYVQTIKGLIVPKTSTYWDLETRLSLFFKINHTYKIIYVKKDGSMFAISDAWISMGLQIVPVPHETYSEWSIDFTIGNNGWREYMEDESGKEIYANNVVLPLISAASGGEVWESVEGEEMSGEGSTIVLNGTKNGATITSLEFYGDTEQQTYTGKNKIFFNPITVTSNDIEWTVTNDSISAFGTATSNWSIPVGYVSFASPLPAGRYTFSIPTTIDKSFQLNLREEDNTSHDITILAGNKSVTFTTAYTAVSFRFALRAESGTTTNINIPNQLQLEAGSTATPYESYVGGNPAPSPDYPQDIYVATGSQSITFSDGVNSQAYTIDLGSIELAKIGTYQDYIYKSGDDWYIHKEIAGIVLTGDVAEGWSLSSNGNFFLSTHYPDINMVGTNVAGPIMSNYYIASKKDSLSNALVDYGIGVNNNSPRLYIRNKDIANVNDFNTWLSTHNTIVYYAIATPTDTKITDNTLIGELEALAAVTGYNGQTIITASPSGTNLPAILAVTMQNPTISGEVWDNVGTEWEMGNGGVQTVNIASTQAIYPVWVVEGPCINPKLQNNTTDTIAEFDGTVATGQTLIVDFEAGTAYLDSALVTRYVAGIVSFAPGENMAGFNSDGGATQESTISWNNIIN